MPHCRMRMAYGHNFHAIFLKVQHALHQIFTKVNLETASIQKSKKLDPSGLPFSLDNFM
jgi:hypothetical protein